MKFTLCMALKDTETSYQTESYQTEIKIFIKLGSIQEMFISMSRLRWPGQERLTSYHSNSTNSTFHICATIMRQLNN